MGKSIELAFRFTVTVYDACFLALAQTTGSLLVTADDSFYRKIQTSGAVLHISYIP